ncbi:MAG: hypothetical protein H7322_17805 [Ramlibacter sp.]|nr:hypothetical protein [Ramlibacter sp.]
MSSIVYFSLWLVAALVVIALVSATVARGLRLREVRQLKALELLDALDRYSEWAAAQQRAAFFRGDGDDVETALEEARHINQGWFPELAAEMVEILIVHNRLVDFLWNQQLLRLKDPERWLESDHDSRFLELWRQHRYAIEGMQIKLRSLAHVQQPEREEHHLA